MSENQTQLICDECDRPIEVDPVWYRPFGTLAWESSTTARFIAHASTAPLDNGLVFHPECFTYRTGMPWPPDDDGTGA